MMNRFSIEQMTSRQDEHAIAPLRESDEELLLGDTYLDAANGGAGRYLVLSCKEVAFDSLEELAEFFAALQAAAATMVASWPVEDPVAECDAETEEEIHDDI